MDSLFETGGPHDIKRISPDKFEMSITIPPDSDGYVGRACPEEACSPGYFKVKPGTGITNGHTVAYCPYCQQSTKPTDFHTEAQRNYAVKVLENEALKGVDRMIENALGLGPGRRKKIGGGFLSIEMSYQSPVRQAVSRPLEEELRRDICCPNCGLNHAVFGLANWCPDCGTDIFLTHVEAEFAVIKTMLSDVERRREQFGLRVAAKDIENCLEDTVSIYEAVLRAMVIRFLKKQGVAEDGILAKMKKIGNAFQSIRRSEEIFRAELSIALYEEIDPQDVERLSKIFEKRHPIAHNLGVVDRKYLEKMRAAESEGEEIRVSADEIQFAISASTKIFTSLHRRVFLTNYICSR